MSENEGEDTISGEDGDDVVIGGRGNDTLQGSDGDDVLAGGEGSNAHIGYNPERITIGASEDWMTRPPVVGLFHEMVHAQDFANGTLANGETDQGNGYGTVPNYERVAVGLPYDHDGIRRRTASPRTTLRRTRCATS